MTLDEHLAALDDLRDRGRLAADDHGLARARAFAAVRRGEPLPSLPGPSRVDDAADRRRGRRAARRERRDTGMSRAQQTERDELDALRRARDAQVVGELAAADRALAERRITAEEHEQVRFRLERLGREPVRVRRGGPTADGRSALARLADALGDPGGSDRGGGRGLDGGADAGADGGADGGGG